MKPKFPRWIWLMIAIPCFLVIFYLFSDSIEFRSQRIVEKFETLYQMNELTLKARLIEPAPNLETEWANLSWNNSLSENRSWEVLDFEVPADGLKDADERRRLLTQRLEDLEFYDEYQMISFIYESMSLNDRTHLSGLVKALKIKAKNEGFGFLEFLNFTISMIQEIPYTAVLPGPPGRACPFGDFTGDCLPLAERNGCCDNVVPFAVYSPIEFAMKRTGDCDTRSLFAYTILSELGYEVTMLNSNRAAHSVLGIHIPNPQPGLAYVLGKDNKKYYFWELTSALPLGQYSTPGHSLSTWFSAIN